MILNVIMFVAALFVAAAMALTLLWFFKKLRQIEKERWGDKL